MCIHYYPHIFVSEYLHRTQNAREWWPKKGFGQNDFLDKVIYVMCHGCYSTCGNLIFHIQCIDLCITVAPT